jgi:purine-binding chemotaxis protein CheW
MKDDGIILRQRADKLSGNVKENLQRGESIPVVEFLLIPERYCVPSAAVSEVLPLKEITAIPGVPGFIAGIMNVRGKIISIVNLKSFFNLKEIGLTERNKIIVLRHRAMEFGIVTDAITGTGEVHQSSLYPPPVTLNGIGAEYITGVTQDGLILLDVAAILSSSSLIIKQ